MSLNHSTTTETTTTHHDRVVTAFFDTRAAAEKAKADILAAGMTHHSVSITEGRGTSTTGSSTATDGEGFWGSLKNIFAPEADKHVYAEGLHRGGFLLTAQTSETDYDRILDILDADGAVDMDERESQWRSEGWTGRHEGYAFSRGTSTVAAAPVAALGTGTSTAATTGVASERTTALSRDETHAADGMTDVTGASPVGGLGGETIQLAEEQLRVGKRDVNHGRVRLRSYVVEKPVNESVSLHSERVDLARQPVDRALGAGENLFQERTISAEEHAEEAVASKDARVYAEVSLGQVAQDRTQEIHDTVRKTEVEVDDGRTGHVGVGAAALPTGTAGLATEIVERMEVRASDGTHIGTVDHLDGGDGIKLTKSDSSDGRHHLIPRSWVDHVDAHVHLNKTANEVRTGWTAA